MTMANRESCRDELADLLDARLVDSLGIVQSVYNHKVGDPQGESPIVAVLSAGSGRPVETFGDLSAMFYLEIQVWVLYADPDSTPVWTPALAEDRLDRIEKEVAQVINDNVSTDVWDDIDYADRSTVADVTVRGGAAYILERIPIEVQVY